MRWSLVRAQIKDNKYNLPSSLLRRFFAHPFPTYPYTSPFSFYPFVVSSRFSCRHHDDYALIWTDGVFYHETATLIGNGAYALRMTVVLRPRKNLQIGLFRTQMNLSAKANDGCHLYVPERNRDYNCEFIF